MSGAMDVLNMTTDEKEQTFRCVAACLHVGNIEFDRDPKGQEEVRRRRGALVCVCASGPDHSLSQCCGGRTILLRITFESQFTVRVWSTPSPSLSGFYFFPFYLLFSSCAFFVSPACPYSTDGLEGEEPGSDEHLRGAAQSDARGVYKVPVLQEDHAAGLQVSHVRPLQHHEGWRCARRHIQGVVRQAV